MANLINIETLLLDFIEGNLSPDLAPIVKKYLIENPNVAQQIGGLAQIGGFPKPNHDSPDFSFLKQPTEKYDVFDSETIDSLLEDTKTTNRLAALHPDLEPDIRLFSSLKVMPRTESVPDFLLVADEAMTPHDALTVMASEGDLPQKWLNAVITIKGIAWTDQVNRMAGFRLKPNAMEYPDKAALYQTPVVQLWHRTAWAVGVAAATLAAAFLFFLPATEADYGNRIAVVKLKPLESSLEMAPTVPVSQLFGADENSMSASEVSAPVNHTQVESSDEPVRQNLIAQMPLLGAKPAQSSVELQIISGPAPADINFTAWAEPDPEKSVSDRQKKSVDVERWASIGLEKFTGISTRQGQSVSGALAEKALESLNKRESITLSRAEPIEGPKAWSLRVGRAEVVKNAR